MNFDTLLLDLDDTVYPAESGLWGAIGLRINQFMVEEVHLDPQGISELRERLFSQYGTTMRGLIAEYGINSRDYLAYVHDVPLQQFIQPDQLLRTALSGLQQRLVVFTNADRAHAHRVLKVVGIDDLIDQIVDVVDVDPYCKPQIPAFKIALSLAGVTDPARVAFFDDNVSNLKVARSLGLYTVRVGREVENPEYHACISSLSDLRKALFPATEQAGHE
ncbi:MAG: pyrimidine 5'-nucleotidase [Anaerolineae bacterium]|nr:pyrimidine 5'-nucleotidase [Anaerolineae bacterium]